MSASMHCCMLHPWSAATSGRNVAVRLHCRAGSVKEIISPCLPTSQSCQLSASSKALRSDTEQLSCDTSLSCMGEKRESRKALQGNKHEISDPFLRQHQHASDRHPCNCRCWCTVPYSMAGFNALQTGTGLETTGGRLVMMLATGWRCLSETLVLTLSVHSP